MPQQLNSRSFLTLYPVPCVPQQLRLFCPLVLSVLIVGVCVLVSTRPPVYHAFALPKILSPEVKKMLRSFSMSGVRENRVQESI